MRRKYFLPLLCMALLSLFSLVLAGCGAGNASSATVAPSPTATSLAQKAKEVPVTLSKPVTLTKPSTPAPTVQVSWTNPYTMYATGTAIVRNAPNTDGTILTSYAPATAITVYGNVQGEAVNGVSMWYRVSDRNSDPKYIYGGRLSNMKTTPAPTQTSTGGKVLGPPPPPPPAPAAPVATGKVIFVNLSTQYLYAYENGAVVRSFPITSGRPELYTPAGTFTVLSKGANLTFYSPWPVGSPYYYSPEHVDYALKLTTGGIYIHTAGWREYNDFGPGTQNPHTLPDGTQSTGSHGCINTRVSDGQWYYSWAPVGMTVVMSY
ncbi:L,D-transpeptidase [Ktedonobacter racemifer]|uniref:ErfK/YbiS/YcfS/YnhG family protein n=1 Tax=Ktedonobacter racemifer DSM 44963 TaxID=485913 RepID=D6TF67_KTERA|nr:L,D-transpeptidase [Ktedonobacter racemifer]EFH90467.1 ErfK/YbiS/YcfS/YnhG family protein [Ktedonobacter racemifer DSM 44963]